jgi:cyclic pyranopterin phosphate synthase
MESGQIRMIDVTQKKETKRQAVAKGRIQMKPATLRLIRKGGLEKGDVLAVAKTAGIMAAKETHRLIPLCHPIQLTNITIEFYIPENGDFVEITASAKGIGKTGFEMEALVAVAMSALTVYDMCKAVDRGMTIGEIHLIRKSGGKSGLYLAEERKERS